MTTTHFWSETSYYSKREGLLIPKETYAFLESRNKGPIGLYIFSRNGISPYLEAFDQRSISTQPQDEAEIVIVNPEKRIIIPEYLREHARLEGKVMFVGNPYSDSIEIWNKDELGTVNQIYDEAYRKNMESLLG